MEQGFATGIGACTKCFRLTPESSHLDGMRFIELAFHSQTQVRNGRRIRQADPTRALAFDAMRFRLAVVLNR
jgi:hypothetical protein